MEENDMLELGGNIQLMGFSEMDKATLIITKKLVGNYVKQMTQEFGDISKLEVHHKGGDDEHELVGRIVINGKEYTAEQQASNLYMGLDTVLKKLEANLAENRPEVG